MIGINKGFMSYKNSNKSYGSMSNFLNSGQDITDNNNGNKMDLSQLFQESFNPSYDVDDKKDDDEDVDALSIQNATIHYSGQVGMDTTPPHHMSSTVTTTPGTRNSSTSPGLEYHNKHSNLFKSNKRHSHKSKSKLIQLNHDSSDSLKQTELIEGTNTRRRRRTSKHGQDSFNANEILSSYHSKNSYESPMKTSSFFHKNCNIVTIQSFPDVETNAIANSQQQQHQQQHNRQIHENTHHVSSLSQSATTTSSSMPFTFLSSGSGSGLGIPEVSSELTTTFEVATESEPLLGRREGSFNTIKHLATSIFGINTNTLSSFPSIVNTSHITYNTATNTNRESKEVDSHTEVTSASELKASKRSWKKGLSFLVVDDSLANRRMVSKVLQKYGHSVSEATDGQHFIDLIFSNYETNNNNSSTASHSNNNNSNCYSNVSVNGSYTSSNSSSNSNNSNGTTHAVVGTEYDVVLIDDSMPNLSGPEAIKVARGKHYRGIIIGLTGSIDDETRDHFYDSGAHAVLTKPLDLDKLKSVLLKYL